MIELEEIPKTSDGLRSALFDEINGVRSGKRTLAQARVVSKIADQILILTRLEIESGRIPQLEGDKGMSEVSEDT